MNADAILVYGIIGRNNVHKPPNTTTNERMLRLESQCVELP